MAEFLNEFSFAIEIKFRLEVVVFNGLRGCLVKTKTDISGEGVASTIKLTLVCAYMETNILVS